MEQWTGKKGKATAVVTLYFCNNGIYHAVRVYYKTIRKRKRTGRNQFDTV